MLSRLKRETALKQFVHSPKGLLLGLVCKKNSFLNARNIFVKTVVTENGTGNGNELILGQMLVKITDHDG